jgi:transglutaminase-like putative cysteine protease
MGQLARNELSSPIFAEEIGFIFNDDVPSLSEIEKFLRDHFVYQAESFEIIRTPQFMLDEWLQRGWFSGDCDDVSTLAAALLICSGYPAKFVAIRYSHPSEFEHVFVESNGYRIDPTVPPGTVHKELERMTLEV